MQIDKRQDSTCTSRMSLVLNKRNISSEEIVLLNNNNKVSLAYYCLKVFVADAVFPVQVVEIVG